MNYDQGSTIEKYNKTLEIYFLNLWLINGVTYGKYVIYGGKVEPINYCILTVSENDDYYT